MSIKLIIFDQDGTLYPNTHKLFTYTRKITKEWIAKSLNISSIEVETIYEKLAKKYPNPYLGFISLGLSIKDYMLEVFDKIEPGNFLNLNPILYEYFAKDNTKKALVTLASPKYTQKLQEKLGIKQYYENILYLKDFKTYNKKECYKKLAKDFNIKFSEICVVGDSYYNDILPAIELGCNVILISKNKKEFDNILIYDNIYEIIKNEIIIRGKDYE